MKYCYVYKHGVSEHYISLDNVTRVSIRHDEILIWYVSGHREEIINNTFNRKAIGIE